MNDPLNPKHAMKKLNLIFLLNFGVLHCGCSLQEGLQGPGGGPGGPGQGQGEDDHSSSPHHFPQTGCTLNFNSWRSVDFHF